MCYILAGSVQLINGRYDTVVYISNVGIISNKNIHNIFIITELYLSLVKSVMRIFSDMSAGSS